MLAVPYGIFMILFVVIPLVLIVLYAFTDNNGRPTLSNLLSFFESAHNINTLLISIFIGFANTALCLIIGFPAAYILSKKEMGFGKATILLFVMPMWINFVLHPCADGYAGRYVRRNNGFHADNEQLCYQRRYGRAENIAYRKQYSALF